MEIIRFDRVVSVTSEIQGHPAKNILREEIDRNKNWLSEKGSKKSAIILQLERAAILTSIHIGNAYSAFVEILAGKAADTTDRFECLVPMSVLMSPQDSTTGNNQNCTRFFNKSDFSTEAAQISWDRLKVVCAQPFNKHVPFGLSFVHVRGEKEETAMRTPPIGKIAEEKEEDEIKIGSFFKKKRNSAEGPLQTAKVATEETSKESTAVKQTNPSPTKVTAEPKESKKPKKEPSPRESEKKRKDEGKSPRIREKKKMKTEEERKDFKVSSEVTTSKGTRRKKRFEKLLEDVVFVISGFQNPLRGNIRNLALEMGAKYSPDWEDRCTHLICACENTPKFNQVKGKGKIVKKEWLEKCHADRKRYPWRRFALSKNDAKQPESEDEVEEEKESPKPDTPRKTEAREVQKPLATPSKQVKADMAERESSRKKKLSGDEDYNLPTDEDEDQCKEVDTTDYPMPYLPDFLSSKLFYVDPNLKSKSILERYIIAYSGTVADSFNEDVKFYVTEKGGVLLDMIRKKVSSVAAVKPSWICEMNSKQKYTSPEPHLVK